MGGTPVEEENIIPEGSERKRQRKGETQHTKMGGLLGTMDKWSGIIFCMSETQTELENYLVREKYDRS